MTLFTVVLCCALGYAESVAEEATGPAEVVTASDQNSIADDEPTIAELVARIDTDVPRPRYYFKEDLAIAFDQLLHAIIALGGPEAERLLQAKIQQDESDLKKAIAALNREVFPHPNLDPEVDRLSNNLELLTALRRVQQKPDPLVIDLQFPDELKGDTRSLPKIAVKLRSADIEQKSLWVCRGRRCHSSHRQAQWRFEVQRADGVWLDPRRRERAFPDIRLGGGVKCDGPLLYGETLETELPMGDFVSVSEPGEYTVTLLYHPKLPIADFEQESPLDRLTIFRSRSFKLKVTEAPRRVIESSPDDRREAQALIAQLPDKGVVRISGGHYGERHRNFIPPESAAGRLMLMKWRAVPSLLEALTDKSVSRHQRAWVLVILHKTTEERHLAPTRFPDALPKWESGSDQGITASIGGTITPYGQDILIRKWRKLADRYFEFRETGGNEAASGRND